MQIRFTEPKVGFYFYTPNFVLFLTVIRNFTQYNFSYRPM